MQTMSAKPWIITVAVCGFVTAALAGIKFVQISQAMAFMETFPPPYETVTVASAEADEWQPTRLLSGTVQSPEYLVVSAETPGRIVELPYQSGETVPAGAEVLVLFDDDVEAQRDALQADLNLVETQLSRNLTLEADSLVSQDQLDILKARKLSVSAQIAVLEARLSRMTVRAPFAGTMGIYSQRVGDLMRFGEVLTTLTGLEPTRWIDFKVPQGLASLVVGDTVEIHDVNQIFAGPAKVIAVSAAFAQGTRTYDVRAELEAPGLKHGSLVQVAVDTGPMENLMSVPKRSVRWDPKGPHIFVVEEAEADAFLPHRASLRRVEVRGENRDKLFVSGEMVPGELVANKGAFKLEDNLFVSVQAVSTEQ
jgi:membrane fusion protein (multidrug efflux system)